MTQGSGIGRKAARLAGFGQFEECCTWLRTALRTPGLDPLELASAGSFVIENWDRLAPYIRSVPARVALFGQLTTNFLSQCLAGEGWARNLPIRVREGHYDNVLQELECLASGSLDVLVLIPWQQRLMSETGSLDERTSAEVRFWEQAWSAAKKSGVRRIVQVGYDWVSPGALGLHAGGFVGDIAAVDQVNRELRRRLPRGNWFIDLTSISGLAGRREFYDRRQYCWTKDPFSPAGAALLAAHLVAAIRGLLTGPKKLLAVDLDDTLWGGIVGEVGIANIVVGGSPEGEAFLHFQRHLKQLANRGILLAAISKNNAEDARRVFQERGEMLLRLEDFAAFSAGWGDKAQALITTCQQLRIDLGTCVFFDDNPAERELIRQALPSVEVVEVPNDPAEFVDALQSGLWFETVSLTDEDSARKEQYSAEKARTELAASMVSLDDYLRSLEMRGTAETIGQSDLPRVAQLIAKTNQFNATTRRYSEIDVEEILARPGAIGLALRLRDKYGDHGLVGIALALPENSENAGRIVIDTFLLSCRVIGRTAEHFLVNRLVNVAARRGYGEVIGEYIASERNGVVANLWPSMGFERLPEIGDGVQRYIRSTAAPDLDTRVLPVT